MLHYLRIFSWFLLTFGSVGFIAIALGFAPHVTPKSAALGLMATQAGVAGLIVYGFRLHREQRVSRSLLIYSGWTLIVLLVILGQWWVNIQQIRF